MSHGSDRGAVSGALQAALLALVAVVAFYHKSVIHPNSYLFNLHGDGLVNYFSFAWHITYDQTLLSFDGMHYPYGEYLPFVDCHPALSSLLHCVQVLGINVSENSICILNLLMLLSPLACAWFFFLILRHFNAPRWAAIVGAPVITLLSSQVLLMQFGHYALSYSVFFPLGWYFLLKYNDKPHSIRWSFAIILNILFWGYTHNYLGAILLAFTGIVHIQAYLFRISETSSRDIRSTVLRIIQIVIPLFTFYLIAILLDPHEGRIEMPFNPAHTASVYSVGVPNHSMTRALFETLFDLSPQKLQPWARVGNYIGIPSLIGLIVMIMLFLKWILSKQSRRDMSYNGLKPLFPYLVSSTLLLGLAMGLHFRITGPEWLEYIPLVKQFAGLGRFAWAFFYVICVATIVLIASIQNIRLRNVILVSALLVYFLESIGYHKYVAGRITQTPNYLDVHHPENNALNVLAREIDKNTYQAIIPLPFYHKSLTPGTFSESEQSIVYSTRFAYITGIPLVSAVLSRYSIQEGRNIIQLFMPNQFEKPIQKHFPDMRPFLILYTGEELELPESELIQRADTISQTGDLMLAEIPFHVLFDYDHQAVAQEFLLAYDTLPIHRSGWRLSDTSAFVEYKSFDLTPSDTVYLGPGAYSGQIKEEHIIFTSEQLTRDKEYVLTFWYYNHLYDQLYNNMWLEEWEDRDSVISKQYLSPTSGQLSDQNWVWNEIAFTVRSEKSRVVLRSQGRELYGSTFYVDELMLREAGADVFLVISEDEDVIYLKNNQTVARLRK